MGTGQYPQPPAPTKISHKVPPAFFRATGQIWLALNSQPEHAMHNYYRPVSPELLIAHLGKVCPVYGGKPIKQVMPLLMAAGSPYDFANKFAYRMYGLVFTTYPVAGRSKIRARLSVSGLKLLDHWADQYPSFKPFVQAFVTKTARREIIETCFDFELGVLPVSLQRQKAMSEAILAKDEAILEAAAKVNAKKHRYTAKFSNAVANARTLFGATQANPNLINQQALHQQLLQSQYSNALGAQIKSTASPLLFSGNSPQSGSLGAIVASSATFRKTP